MHPCSQLRRLAHPGFSVLELLLVMTIIAIMIAVALPYISAHKRAYQVDDFGAELVDVLRYANQRALSERQVMRVELTPSTDTDRGTIQVIDQNRIAPGTADDEVVRNETLPLKRDTTIVVTSGALPVPPAPFNFLPPPLTGGKVTVSFNPDGSVTDNTDIPRSFSIAFFTPDANGNPNTVDTRSITLFGPTTSIKPWRFDAATNSFVEM